VIAELKKKKTPQLGAENLLSEQAAGTKTRRWG